MGLTKILWALRAGLYQIMYRNIRMPSYIGKPIYISRKRKLCCGKRVRIYPGLRAEIVDANSQVVIGDNVSIGQNFHVVSYHGDLVIGSNVTIAGNVFVTNCDHDYNETNKSVLENELLYRETVIGDGCFLGNNVALLAGTRLGKHCVVGANSVVRGDFPDYSVIAGSPARVVKTVSGHKED